MQSPSDRELLDTIIERSIELGRTPKRDEMPNKNMIYKRFGSWKIAVQKAGLKPISKKGIKKTIEYDKQELIKIIKQKGVELGRTPKISDMPYGTHVFKKYFGNWENALLSCELTPRRNTVNKQHILKELDKYIKSVGYTPSYSEATENIEQLSSIVGHGVTYADILGKLGYKPSYKLPEKVTETNEELKEMYIKFSHSIGKGDIGATLKDLNSSDAIYNADVFQTRFGGLAELKIKCGFTPRPNRMKPIYTKQEISDMLLEKYHELGRKPMNKELKDDKTLPSPTTICRYFKVTSMQEVWNELLKSTE